MPLPSGGDYDLDAGLSGLGFRNELNPIIEALASLSSDASLPPVTFPFMLRGALDTTPNEIQVRNPSNNAFLKMAEITDSALTMFSNGAAVPSLGTAQTFTAAQTVDIAGSPGSLSVGSDQSSGIVARIPMFGHNSVGGNTTGVNLVCRINTNTQGSEDFTFEVEAIRGGASVTVATLGSLSDFRRSGGGGIVDADTVRQAGITLAQIVREATGRFGDGGDFTVDINSFTQAQEGQMFRFNGTSNVTVRLNKLAKGTIIFFQNESSTQATITFAASVSDPVTDFRTSRLTLPGISGQSPVCGVHWYLSDGRRVNIFGDNV